MKGRRNLRFCGIPVGVPELEMIQVTVRDCFGLSRTELAYTLCELLDWRRPNGQLKGHECRQFLEELEEKGVLRLPGNRGTGRKSKVVPKATGEPLEPLPPVIEGTLSELGPVELELVKTPEDRRQWREWVSRYHYLGCTVPFGAHLRYFARTSRPRPRRVGCIQVSSPAWRMAPRDKWIGWDEEQRVRGLQRIVQNSRFLLLPWVKIPHLASAALARLARQIPDDWEAHYAIRPVLLETLVDPARFKGTCYRAANWIALGITTGRGRMDREHKRHGAEPKEVLVYPLHRKAREKLLET
jgi:hypothetical protein